MSLRIVFHSPIDWPGIAIYSFEFLLWVGIVLCRIFLGRGENGQDVSPSVLNPSLKGIEPHQSFSMELSQSRGELIVCVSAARTNELATSLRSLDASSMTVFRTASRASEIVD